MTSAAHFAGRARAAIRLLLLAGLCAILARQVHAQEPELNTALNESVIFVSKKGVIGSTELETTLYKPDGPGPFPVVVINHGKADGNPQFQSRYRPAIAARYFLQRGYVVVVPMRQGFSKSSGGYIGGGCNVESNGRAQAEDVKAVLDYTLTQPYADKSRVLVVGQSHGGWTTLAFGALNYPGVKGLINFAGGLRQEGCAGWQGGLARGAAAYAVDTGVPSLWFYGDNDSYFSPSTWREMAERYNGGGNKARVVAFGAFGSDSHSLFGSSKGAPIWQPEVTRFLESIGLPSQPLPAFARFAIPQKAATPPKTNFAAIDEEPKLPFLSVAGRAGYREFLAKEIPRAFAAGPAGGWAWAEGSDDAMKRALDRCNRNAKEPCKLYAVDNDVVWTTP
ncbi:MAG: CocE/NonD family hydrolase [Polaromonas sp.]